MRLHEYATQERESTCCWCEKEFLANHAKTRFCSDKCRQGWRRLKGFIIDTLQDKYPQVERLLR